ncbi:MAG TPA: cytochrome P450 [Ktedonobacteraceae bacterium]
MGATIPGTSGLPFLGETLAIFTNPVNYFSSHQRRYGNVFQTRLIGKPSVVLCGARAQQQIFLASGNENAFGSREAYSFVEPFVGTSLLQMDGGEHQKQRKLITPAFQSHTHLNYVTRINRVFERIISHWPEQGTRVFYQEARAIAFRVSTSLMLGIEEGPKLVQLNSLIHTLFGGPLALVRLKLPFTKYGKAMAARPMLEKHLLELVNQHRKTPATDVLALLLLARDEQGQPLSDEQLLDHLKLLLFAGYDTTTATMTWGLLELLRHPNLYERVRAEVGVGKIGSEAPVTVEELRAMPLLDAFLKETLRLHPVTAFLLRSNQRPYEFEEYTIPAGWQIILPISHTHRSPEYFTNPEQCDPDRFLPPREEEKKAPYAWMAFGGGGHTCLGLGIAQIEMKTVLTRLLRQFDLQLVADQDVSPAYIPVGRPRGGTVVSFQRRTIP